MASTCPLGQFAERQDFQPVEFSSAELGLRAEEEIFARSRVEGVRAGLVWTCPPAFVIGATDAIRNDAGRCREWARPRGFDVALRRTGGTVVRVGWDTVMVALMIPTVASAGCDIDGAYGQLYAVAREALAKFGVGLALGARTGAYCDGRHNLLAVERKLGGTAQRVCGGRHAGVLAHCAINVDTDVGQAIDDINGLYAHCGITSGFDASSCTSIWHELGARSTGRDRQTFKTATAALLGEAVASWCADAN